MIQNQFLLRLAILSFVALSNSVFAVELQQAVVTGKGDGMIRSYTLTTGGKPDERFKFSAQKASGSIWNLTILPTDTFDWASELPFKDYTEVVYRCVDRFLADVPDAQVLTVHICITRDSKTWQKIKNDMVPFLKNRTGFAVGFSGLDHGGAGVALDSSPEIQEIGRHLAKRFKRKFAYSMLDLDYLIMRITTPEDYRRTWQDIVKLPDLSLDMESLKFSMEFKPIERMKKK